MSEVNVDRLKAQRAGHRGFATKVVNEVKAIIEEGDAHGVQRVKELRGVLVKRIQTIVQLDERIVEHVKIEDVEQEVLDSSDLEQHLNGVISDIDRFVASSNENIVKQDNEPHEPTFVSPASVSVNNDITIETSNQVSPSNSSLNVEAATGIGSHATPPKVRLPKLTLPKFKGEVTSFTPFWDIFQSSIHNNASLSTVDKFSYLKSCIEGEAARAIEGLPVTEANYQPAIDILKQRYGNKQQLVSAHMDELLKLPSCNEKVSQLKYVYDKINVHVRGLNSLGVDSEKYGSLLIPIIMSRVPREIALQVARVTAQEIWNINDVLEIIRKEVEARGMSESIRIKEEFKGQQSNIRKSSHPSASALFVKDKQGQGSPNCVFCKGEHYSAECNSIIDVNSRMKKLREENRCFLCLKTGHRLADCRRSRNCRVCSKRHHHAVCNNSAPRNSNNAKLDHDEKTTRVNRDEVTTNTVANSNNDNPNGANSSIEDSMSTNSNVANTKLFVVLQTAKAIVKTQSESQCLQARILFDSGSQRSYVTEKLRENLRAPTVKSETLNLNTFGDKSFVRRKCDVVELNVSKDGKDGVNIKALTFPVICSRVSSKVEIQRYDHLQSLELADDVHSDNNDSIDILIGSDYYWQFMTGNVIKGNDGPVAVESTLGWIVSGVVGKSNDQTKKHFTNSNLVIGSEIGEPSNDRLSESLEAFWNTESIGIRENVKNDQRKCTDRINFDGERYEIQLPLIQESTAVPSHFQLSMNRLRSLGKRLRRDKELAVAYDNVIKEQLDSGIIERIDDDSEVIDGKVHYLPHHGVIRKERTTTKLRIVFDGSARESDNESSFNDLLDKGPNLTPHVFNILAKFRSYLVPLAGDIEKAFHQISIKETDRDLLRFLWYEDVMDESSKIVRFRFCRLVFGLTSSPAILNSTIQRHLENYKTTEPTAANLLSRSLYVDDFTAGSNDVESAFDIHVKAKQIMKEGGFNLRKWKTSSAELRERIRASSESEQNPKPTEKEKTLNKEEEDIAESKILGLKWDVEEDMFRFDFSGLISYVTTLPATKRSLLRASAKLFDPLGLISPFIVRLKLCFQDICKQGKVSWDEPLEGELLKQWHKFVEEIHTLSEIKVPRCYFLPGKKLVLQEIHGFSDASEKAYAAVVYLLTYYEDGEIDCQLVASKTRVAPLKKQSIPRLELLGAYLLSKLIIAVRESSIAANDTAEFYWTDSYTVLCWIKNSKPWRQYVQHRVNEIRQSTSKEHWRFCPGSQNPADIPSRSCSGRELTNNSLWWNGPGFLKKEKKEWPDIPTKHDEDKSEEELVKHVPVVTHALLTQVQFQDTVKIQELMDINRFSSRRKLLRVTALVFKFINLLRRKTNEQKSLLVDDLQAAGKVWTRSIQRSSFRDEYQALVNPKTRNKESRRYNQLSLFLDEDGLIRCRGRIEHSTVTQDAKNPILMPSRHTYTSLLIRERHETVYHNGISETLNAIRQTHWIVKGREAVKRTVRKCVICRRYDGRPYNPPPMPNLPNMRVSEDPPFSYTGIDFAGPLYVQCESSKESKKAYCCLFTCASTRALHLELTPSLTVKSFLQAFRRFTSRRGLPVELLTDNAKTFKSASKEVKSIIRSQEIRDYFTNQQVTWKFIMEKAPWWGGFWERLVRSTKRCLKKAIGRSSLNFEELRTLLVEVETTINNRPLTYMYDDDNGVTQPLTPSDLIYGRQIGRTPSQRQVEIISTYKSLTRKAKYHYRLLEGLVKRWKKEYLTSLLQLNSKQTASKTPIAKGDIVLLKEETPARAWWKVAKIEELITSKDDKVRAANVRLLGGEKTQKTSLLRRPVQLLIPLEVR